MNLEETQAVFYDLDGTIVDKYLECKISETFEAACLEAGIEYDHAAFLEIYNTNKGGGVDKYFSAFVQLDQGSKILETCASVDIFQARFLQIYTDGIEKILDGDPVEREKFVVNQGALESIRFFRSQGKPVGIVTNGREAIATATLKACGIIAPAHPAFRDSSGEIDNRIVAADTGSDPVVIDVFINRNMLDNDTTDRKPSGRPYELACIQTNTDPAYCIAWEDSGNGFRSANNAGIGTIYFVNTKETAHSNLPIANIDTSANVCVVDAGKGQTFIQALEGHFNCAIHAPQPSQFNIAAGISSTANDNLQLAHPQSQLQSAPSYHK